MTLNRRLHGGLVPGEPADGADTIGELRRGTMPEHHALRMPQPARVVGSRRLLRPSNQGIEGVICVAPGPKLLVKTPSPAPNEIASHVSTTEAKESCLQ
jgi:hypothetical protein